MQLREQHTLRRSAPQEPRRSVISAPNGILLYELVPEEVPHRFGHIGAGSCDSSITH